MAVNIAYKDPESCVIFKFGKITEASAAMKNVLGGKGANLAEMASLGLPIPPGFTIPCKASVRFNEMQTNPSKLASFQSALWAKVKDGLSYLKEDFGYMPLVSVRSGARVSMPGMMDTILNVGLTSETLPFWAKKIGERAALDSYRRLIQMYASVAMDVPMDDFDEILAHYKKSVGVTVDSDLSVDTLKRIVTKFKEQVYQVTDTPFPDTLDDQLKGAIGAVFRSWNNPRAVEYRKINKIPGDWGTAVNIQAMVFGNMNDASCTGVLFSRHPSSGENVITGEYLINAQGEDVVAGIRTPDPISTLWKWDAKVSNSLFEMVNLLEKHYKDMQDIEFTVQDGKLYLLQTRSGKRSPLAAFQIAHDLAVEGMITKEVAVSRVSQTQLLMAMSDQIDPKFNVAPDLVGIAAGGGVVTGVAVFTAEDAVNCTEPCILVRKETDPNDIAGMNASVGILTSIGGLTSHAAVVARGMNKSCVVGCTDMTVKGKEAFLPKKAFAVGQKITIDGATGRVWVNITVPVVSASNNPVIKALVGWAASDGVFERVTFPMAASPATVKETAATLTGRVHVDTATFDTSSYALADMMSALGSGLSASKVEMVHLDMSSMQRHLNQADALVDWMFGAPSDVAVTAKAASISGWPKGVIVKATLLHVEGLAPATAKALTTLGVKMSGKVTTFADLLSMDGPMEIDDEVITKVFGGKEALAAAKKMVEQVTGKAFGGKHATPVYWYDFLNQGAA